jgi:nucleoid-associated protein YgaU
MFAQRTLIAVGVLLALLLAALSGAHASKGAGHELRYRVHAGETLWTIAEAHYSGDPRKAIWRIEERNGLGGASIRAGTVLYLPQ